MGTCLRICIDIFDEIEFFIFKEEKTQQKASEAKEVLLYGQFPPIDKMDASISTLAACEYNSNFSFVDVLKS